MPPESPPVLMPGIKAWMPLAFRDDGIAASTSRSTMVCTRALCTSTIGDSPVTVIVSSSVADAQLGVDRGDEVAAQLDAFALDRAEAGQRERHRVGAGAKVDDAVLPGVVGDDRSGLSR